MIETSKIPVYLKVVEKTVKVTEKFIYIWLETQKSHSSSQIVPFILSSC
jgi:hypothetical protein